ncbi:hypothetical protein BGX31_005291 [Mortierella sp. GBA43]|nr:hypothetical protein BGX31_005291 [Mortierella sp. GBA43]
MTSSEPDTYWNMSITQGSQTVTTKRYLHALEGAKKKTIVLPNGQQANVCELESRIQPVEVRQVNDTDPLPVWMPLRKSIEDHVTSTMRVDEPLREFYSSMLFKVKTWELQQAKTATSNKSIDRLLSTAESLREEADAHRILIVVGDGAFTSHKGPTLHQHFITELKKKANGRNILVTCTDEFRTSISCCQCGSLGSLDHRRFICTACQHERDRDHNAATNMARAALQLIRGLPWPAELTREL